MGKAAASWNMKEKLYEDLRDPSYGAAYIFFGYKFDCDASFHLLSENCGRSLTVKDISLDEVRERSYFLNSRIEQPAQNYLFEEDEDPTPIYALRIEKNAYEECVEIPALKGGTVMFDRLPAGMRDRASGSPAHFLALDAFDSASMGEMWNTALSESREGEIVDDMRILD